MKKLILIVAEPGAGKTGLAYRLGAAFSAEGHSVGHFDDVRFTPAIVSLIRDAMKKEDYVIVTSPDHGFAESSEFTGAAWVVSTLPAAPTRAELLVRVERERQIASEGWSAEHDDSHTLGEIGRAAHVYFQCAVRGAAYVLGGAMREWPWSLDFFKPWKKGTTHFPRLDQHRCLVKAGALVRAEIERLKRMDARIIAELNRRAKSRRR